MRGLNLYWDDLRSADDPYTSYKDAIVHLPDIAAYRAAVDSKLSAYGTNEFVDGPALQPNAEDPLAD